MSSPEALHEVLSRVREREYVRFTADWLSNASDLDQAPALTGRPVIDALVAAAAGYAALMRGEREPAWACEAARKSPTFWYIGPDALLANAVATTPSSFKYRGLLIDRDSLDSV